jgi:hypothetical protein
MLMKSWVKKQKDNLMEILLKDKISEKIQFKWDLKQKVKDPQHNTYNLKKILLTNNKQNEKNK